MSVRGTTHARVMRRVIIREGERIGNNARCCWDQCDTDGYDLYKARVRDTAHGIEPAIFTWYLFCSERHKQYWVDSYLHPGTHGKLQTGNKGLA